MTRIDLSAVSQIISDVGVLEIIPRFRKLADGDIEMKGVDDPVTIADKAAEETLSRRLIDYLPGSVVIGEESYAKNAGIISRFSGDQDVWVIDPIDGTRNFISGVPEFGVMVGLVRRKQTIASWIHDPSSGDTLMCEKGGGVFLGSHRMRLAAHEKNLPFVGLIGSKLLSILERPEIAPFMKDAPPVQKGSSAAFDYGRMFTGPAHFAGSKADRASFLLYRMSKPWDHIPGLAMIDEAGGYAANLKGQPYNIESSRGGLLMTDTRERWQELYDAFNPALQHLRKVL